MRTTGIGTITQPMTMIISGGYCKRAPTTTTAATLRGCSLQVIVITVVLGRVEGLTISKSALYWSSERRWIV